MKKSNEFQEFCNQIQEAVRQCFPDDVKVELHKVLKNNSTELDSLVVLSPDQTISPNFYLQIYFEEYKKGRDIVTLAEQIEETYYKVLRDGHAPEFDLSYENCVDKIVFRLVSFQENSGLLREVPFIRFLDMAVTFHILLRQDEDGIGSVRITNRLSEKWDLEAKDLFVLARENTKRFFPQRIYSMSSVMASMLDSEESSQDEEAIIVEGEYDGLQASEPYVITNSNGINGAAVILYSNALNEIGEFLGEDYYLLPSSIHEVLVIAASARITEAELREMVREVNCLCVAREEVLSGNIYRYECRTETIRICREGYYSQPM